MKKLYLLAISICMLAPGLVRATSVDCRSPKIVETKEVQQAAAREAIVVIKQMLANIGIKPIDKFQTAFQYRTDHYGPYGEWVSFKEAKITFQSVNGTPFSATVKFLCGDHPALGVDFLTDNEGNYIPDFCKFNGPIGDCYNSIDIYIRNRTTGVFLPANYGTNVIQYTGKIIAF